MPGAERPRASHQSTVGKEGIHPRAGAIESGSGIGKDVAEACCFVRPGTDLDARAVRVCLLAEAYLPGDLPERQEGREGATGETEGSPLAATNYTDGRYGLRTLTEQFRTPWRWNGCRGSESTLASANQPRRCESGQAERGGCRSTRYSSGTCSTLQTRAFFGARLPSEARKGRSAGGQAGTLTLGFREEGTDGVKEGRRDHVWFAPPRRADMAWGGMDLDCIGSQAQSHTQAPLSPFVPVPVPPSPSPSPRATQVNLASPIRPRKTKKARSKPKHHLHPHAPPPFSFKHTQARPGPN
jgi:hypothetical protein